MLFETKLCCWLGMHTTLLHLGRSQKHVTLPIACSCNHEGTCSKPVASLETILHMSDPSLEEGAVGAVVICQQYALWLHVVP